MHIQMYAGLLSFNASLILSIATTLLLNIQCNVYLRFDVHFKQLFLLFTSYKLILFLELSVVFPYVSLFINLYNTFTSLHPFFSASVDFLYQIQYMVLTIVIYQILICNVFLLVLMLALSKVASFQNEAPTFLDQKCQALIFLHCQQEYCINHQSLINTQIAFFFF